MATDDKVKVLEDEFKLIKSELRQTLVSVRDFLLDLKIPPMQEEAATSVPQTQVTTQESAAPEEQPQAEQPLFEPEPQEAMGYNGNNYQEPTGNNGNNGSNYPEPAASSNFPDESPNQGYAAPRAAPRSREAFEEDIPQCRAEPQPTLEVSEPEEDVIEEIEEDDEMTSGEIPMDKEPEMTTPSEKEASDMKINQAVASTSQVNLLANLIRWVSVARKAIGVEQLPVLLDVYAIGGNLPAEMKEVIMHLAEVVADPVGGSEITDKKEPANDQIALCMEINSLSGQLPPELRDGMRRLTGLIIQQSSHLNKSETWSQLLLELHGILVSGGTLQMLGTKDSAKEEKIEEEAAKNAQKDGTAEGSDEETQVAEHPEENADDNPPAKKGVKPARLRLVLPVENGSDQELDLGSIFIDTDIPAKAGNGHKKVSLPKR